MISAYSSEPDFITDFVLNLKEEWDPVSRQLASERLRKQVALLEEVAIRTNQIFSVFDFSSFKYLYYTKNMIGLIGGEKAAGLRWEEFYRHLTTDSFIVDRFISVRSAVTKQLDAGERMLLKTSMCGGEITNLQGKSIRCFFGSRPVIFTKSGEVEVSFDRLVNINPFLAPDAGYWLRITAGSKVFHWRSDSGKVVARDLLTQREKEFLTLWSGGYSVSAIAETAHVSVHTVKNQLVNARDRLMARDNTSLVHLCGLTGILEPSH